VWAGVALDTVAASGYGYTPVWLGYTGSWSFPDWVPKLELGNQQTSKWGLDISRSPIDYNVRNESAMKRRISAVQSASFISTAFTPASLPIPITLNVDRFADHPCADNSKQ